MTYPPSNDPYTNQAPPQYAAPQQPGYGAAPAFNYGSWFQRLGAWVLDALVIAPFSILAAVLGTSTDATTNLPEHNAMYYVFQLMGLLLLGYNRWYMAGTTGQSWGRKALGIRLVSEQTGQPIGAGMAFVRDLTHVLDGMPCLIGYLWPLWDAKKQTFADKLLKTAVVR